MDDYQHPLPGKTYISPSLEAFGAPEKRVRIATKALEHPDDFAFAQIKNELVLRRAEGSKRIITAKFLEADRRIFILSIQGYSAATLKPHNASFSFIGDEIGKLVEFLNHIQSMPLEGRGSRKITDEDLRRVVLSSLQAKSLVLDNQDVFAEVVKHALTREDVVAVGYRKKQLRVFERLLTDEDYFAKVRIAKQCTDESLWQRFFEKNPWIFGYGLSHIYLSGWDGKKLEQVVTGYRVFGRGKRSDALMRSRGFISNLCFVEIKTHKTLLVDSKPYRGACWPPSSELAGAVSQVQGTVALATADIRGRLAAVADDGSPTGEDAYNYVPKSFLVVGSLEEFRTPKGVNEEKHRSFELFRGNTNSPEIITFDELYERSRFIVSQHETEG